MTGSKLIVIRGNSGSGKTSVAREVRARYGRGCALIEQDYFRRIVLREHDSAASKGIAPDFIATAAQFVLDRGYHVVVEGILTSVRYAPMICDLVAAHQGESHVFYLDVSFDETVRRHATRPLASEVTAEQMLGWYESHDVLGVPGEHVIAESSTFEETVAYILDTSRLPTATATTYCPAICPRCRAEHDESGVATGVSLGERRDTSEPTTLQAGSDDRRGDRAAPLRAAQSGPYV